MELEIWRRNENYPAKVYKNGRAKELTEMLAEAIATDSEFEGMVIKALEIAFPAEPLTVVKK